MGVNGIYGLSGSGLDIESMVKVGMMGKQSQLDKLQQKTDLATWKKEAMSSVYSDLSTMNYSTLTQYKLQSNMNAMSATSSDESIVKVTANGSAASMTHKVSVGGLSSNAYLITGDGGITRNNTDATKAKSIYLADNLFPTGSAKSGDAAAVYTIDGNNYLTDPAPQKGTTVSTYTFHATGNFSNTLNIKVDGENYYYKSGDDWLQLSGDDLAGAQKLISTGGYKTTKISGGGVATKIFGEYYGYNEVPGTNDEEAKKYAQLTGGTTDYTFAELGGGTKTYSFIHKTDGLDGFSGYSYTNDEGNTVTKTLDVSSDFSSLVNNDKFISNGKIVGNDDIAISFTVMDGTEKDKSPEELAELKEKNTITYTYGELTSSGKTYNDIVADINALGLNVKASYDAANDSFSLTNKNSGADNKIELQMNTAMAAELFNNLGLKQSVDGALVHTVDGKNYAGIEKRKTVTEYTFNQVQGEGEDPAAINVKRETAEGGTSKYFYRTDSNADWTEITDAEDISEVKAFIDNGGETAKDFLGNSYQGLAVDKATTDFTFTDMSGNKDVKTFTHNDLSSPGTTTYTYKGRTISHDLSDVDDIYETGKTSTAAGKSGSITIDGKTYNNVEDNRITVDGVTYQLQNVSSSAESSDKYTVVGSDGTTVIGTVKEAASAKTVNVVINQDTDAIIEKVKSFVEDYNKMLDSLYEKYSETKYSDYKPLTDSQRDKMTEKQIEKWEEKAKSGLLYHDYTIGKIIDRMRQAVATPVEGLDSKYNSAYSIGIYTSKTNGHIALDEDRLKKALAEDPEAAYKIFGTLPESDSKGNYDYDKMGVAQRLGDVMAQAMKDVKTEAGDSAEISDGSNLGNKIMEFQQKMSDFKTLMSAFETRLFKKYDAMESLLATLGAQMNYITGGQ